jgi:hypothetical protein
VWHTLCSARLRAAKTGPDNDLDMLVEFESGADAQAYLCASLASDAVRSPIEKSRRVPHVSNYSKDDQAKNSCDEVLSII